MAMNNVLKAAEDNLQLKHLTRISVSSPAPGRPFIIMSFVMYPVPPFHFVEGLSTV